MRIKAALGIWLMGVTLWMAVALPDLGLSPLIDAQGATAAPDDQTTGCLYSTRTLHQRLQRQSFVMRY